MGLGNFNDTKVKIFLLFVHYIININTINIIWLILPKTGNERGEGKTLRELQHIEWEQKDLQSLRRNSASPLATLSLPCNLASTIKRRGEGEGLFVSRLWN